DIGADPRSRPRASDAWRHTREWPPRRHVSPADLAIADSGLQTLEPGSTRAVFELADVHEGGEGGVVDAGYEEPVLPALSPPGHHHQRTGGNPDPGEPK